MLRVTSGARLKVDFSSLALKENLALSSIGIGRESGEFPSCRAQGFRLLTGPIIECGLRWKLSGGKQDTSQWAALCGCYDSSSSLQLRSFLCGICPAKAHFAVGGELYPTENLSPKQLISRQNCPSCVDRRSRVTRSCRTEEYSQELLANDFNPGCKASIGI